jgi:hypothetical protein
MMAGMQEDAAATVAHLVGRDQVESCEQFSQDVLKLFDLRRCGKRTFTGLPKSVKNIFIVNGSGPSSVVSSRRRISSLSSIHAVAVRCGLPCSRPERLHHLKPGRQGTAYESLKCGADLPFY